MPATRFPERADGVADRMTGFMAHLRYNGIMAAWPKPNVRWKPSH